jgi:hypothetical protein
MINGPTTPIFLNGQQLEYVKDYTYLGQNLSFQRSSEKEIKRRIGLAWKRFWSEIHINRQIPEDKLEDRSAREVCNTHTALWLPILVPNF